MISLNKKEFKIKIADQDLVFTTSRLAEQANAAVMAQYGETVVLATVVMGKEDNDIDYLPLVVDYEEKFYAVGKILGSRFMRREGHSSDEAVLSGRLIDRTIRPLFDQGIRRDIQIVITILSFDGENDPDFVALMATSLALTISEIPWNGPIAGVRVAKLNNKVFINPQISQVGDNFIFNAFAAGPKNKINMIELEGVEAQEDEIEEAFSQAQKEIDRLVDFQNEVAGKIGKKKAQLTLADYSQNKELVKTIEDFLQKNLKSFDELDEVKEQLIEKIKEKSESELDLVAFNHIFESALDKIVHKNILEQEKRPDKRKLDEIRELYSEVGLLKRGHGSALFIRGGTQSLAITTLASPESAQLVENMEFSGKKRFMLHYNFPPYSTGEIGKMRGPGRREIGHGALAEKAIKNLIPTKEDFPYAIRVVSEILASNGSSSMATVCASSLSLMDAGVPIKKIAAGISMGLMINENGDYKILTDIQGPEDHHGDMDFKVAGTKDGVTAIQLDVKINGLTAKIIKETLARAKKARLFILSHLEKTLAKPRKETSEFAPKILTLKINPEKIGLVIGPGGKTINSIIKRTGATIDIDEEGNVFISSTKINQAEAALKEIESLTHEYKIGDIIEGTVVKILEFGAIVEFGPNQDGMIHVSELKNGFVKDVRSILKEGDFIRAKIIKIENGKVGLSLKALST